MQKKSLKPSLEKLGEIVTQIIHFSGGNKRTFEGIISSSIKQGEFTKFDLVDGRMIMINTQNVDMIEVFGEVVNSVFENSKDDFSQGVESEITNFSKPDEKPQLELDELTKKRKWNEAIFSAVRKKEKRPLDKNEQIDLTRKEILQEIEEEFRSEFEDYPKYVDVRKPYQDDL